MSKVANTANSKRKKGANYIRLRR